MGGNWKKHNIVQGSVSYQRWAEENMCTIVFVGESERVVGWCVGVLEVMKIRIVLPISIRRRRLTVGKVVD